jgi:hypothetical protein
MRDDKFTARDPYRDVSSARPRSRPSSGRASSSVNVGGPIIRDKTFFFASYDGWRYDDRPRSGTSCRRATPGLNGDFRTWAAAAGDLRPFDHPHRERPDRA